MLLIRGAMLPDFETGTTTQADVPIWRPIAPLSRHLVF